LKRNIIDELGSLALATRLKNLSERLAKDVGQIYRELAFDFEPRWFAIIYALKDKETLAVTELSAMLQQTHPAVNQVANILVEKGLVVEMKDEADQRKRLLKLSRSGSLLVTKIEQVWDKIKVANDELLKETDPGFIDRIQKLEQALDDKGMYDRVKDQFE
jgi:DNA-binding MarR family transcriptional regulator